MVSDFSANPYLFRHTERWLSKRGHRPLSAVQDQIGSQATKAMYFLRRSGLRPSLPGVWARDGDLTAIETYPTPCRDSERVRTALGALNFEGVHRDIKDAAVCAVIASMFAAHRDELAGPNPELPEGEGWIWVPTEVLKPVGAARAP